LQKRPIITYDTRPRNASTEWPRCIASFVWQVSFHKRAINYRVLLREMTYEDMASYASLLQSCTEHHTARASHHKSITLQEHHTARASHCKSITLQEHHTARASHCKTSAFQVESPIGRTHTLACVYIYKYTQIYTHTRTHTCTHTLCLQHTVNTLQRNTLQTHCNALQHTAMHCNTLQNTVPLHIICEFTLQHTATQLRHTPPQHICTALQQVICEFPASEPCVTCLQHTATQLQLPTHTPQLSATQLRHTTFQHICTPL